MTPQRIKVGGNVQTAPPRPSAAARVPAACQAGAISGVVKLGAIISKDGTIQHLEVISGHRCWSRPLSSGETVGVPNDLLDGELAEGKLRFHVNLTLSQ